MNTETGPTIHGEHPEGNNEPKGKGLLEYLKGILGESIDDVLKSLIKGGILMALGAAVFFFSQKWNPEKKTIIVKGYVINENGLPLEGAIIRAYDITGTDTSKVDGTFEYTIELAKTDSLLRFYCDKEGFSIATNNREFPQKHSVHGKELIITLSFMLTRSQDIGAQVRSVTKEEKGLGLFTNQPKSALIF